jgi:hypothetical protein
MTLLIWYCFWTASDIGPIASARPMRKKAKKIGMVRMFLCALCRIAMKTAGGRYQVRRKK